MKRYTMEEGLADNTVHAICKDRDGFIWFGTENGLSRFDGSRMKNFTYPEGYLNVQSIHEGDTNLLWLCCNGGILCFDRQHEQFISVITGNKENKYHLNFIPDKNKRGWAITLNSLIHYEILPEHTISGQITGITLAEKDNWEIEKDITYSALCQSPEGILYLATGQTGLISFDPSTNSFSVVNRWKENSGWNVNNMLAAQNALWIATTASGVIRYDLSSGLFEQYTYDPSTPDTSLSHTDAYEIAELDNGQFIAATWNGYTLFIPDNKGKTSYRTEAYTHTASLVHRDLETRMICVCYDPQGLIWVGTHGGGILVSDLRKQFFQTYYQETHNEICDMTSDTQDYIWLATFHQGILRSREPFDPQKRMEFETLSFTKDRTVNCILADTTGIIWFGSNTMELFSYDIRKAQYQKYPIRKEGASYPNGSVWTIYVDKLYRFWIGTSHGLFLFNPLTGTFTEASAAGVIRAIEEMDGYLWLGSTSGLVRYNPGDNQWEKGYENRSNLTATSIRSLLAGDDQLYIGYTEGLGVLNTKNDSITHLYTTKEGLCNNFIGCLAKDREGSVWIGTNAGVSRYSKSTGIFYNYYISGNNRSVLPVGDFLFWGNNRNLTWFNPENIRRRSQGTDRIVLTQLEVDNKPAGIGEKINNQLILSAGLPFIPEITLSDANKNFSLQFSNLSYSYELQKYNYRLTPWQTEWIITTEGEKVSYTNLPHGSYTFEVSSLHPDGSTGEITTLDIILLPHWSKTIWFRLFIFLLLGALLWAILHRIKLQKKRIALEEQWKHELEIARLEKEKEKQINQERESFFIKVSHELRTPLTLIKTPLQEVLQTNKEMPPRLYEQLKLIHTNANSLSGLVDQLLYIQKIKAGMIRLSIQETDLTLCIKRVVDRFTPLAEMKKHTFCFHAGETPVKIWCDPVKIESALINLLSNAFKYTPDQSEITIALNIVTIDDKPYALIEVTDNGPGIPSSQQAHIFDSFITGDKEPAFSTRMGIGLHIVKNTVDLHHGKITLESDSGKGCRFSVYLPSGREHFNRNEYELLPAGKPDTKENTDSYIVTDTGSKNETGRKILVIEDNADIRSYISSLLSREYFIGEAENGEKGVQAALKIIPDLIICDIMMPVKNGFDCCREIKEHPHTAHIPVIMLTAKAEDTDIVRGVRCGADDYLMKPFNPELLKARIHHLIHSREQLKRIYTKTLMMKNTLPKEEDKDDFMQQVINIVETNLEDPDFNVNILAGKLNMSTPTLYRKIKSHSDLSIKEVIRGIRMTKAATLLLSKKYSVQEIAEMVGFTDIPTFRKHFTKQFGVPPSQYHD